ncbi:MAG TPA: amidohydrolase family protein [Acidimicrobiales bacterium]|nr:amidohydrolase family protein [Acidimicrobiales bacterium]
MTVRHEDVKAKLPSRLHAEYDDAVAKLAQTMRRGAGQANQAMMREYDHPAYGRAGAADPVERLKDMDTDGVEAEVLYCEVSAFRYLYLLETGWRDATRAFNDTLQEFSSVDPKRLIVSYQIPIHDIDAAVAEVERVANLGAKSLQLPVFPTELGQLDYFHDRYDPLWSAIQAVDLPICCHIGLNTALEDLARRDPTPQRGVMVPMTAFCTAEAFGMWILGGVLERFPELKLVFVEPGVGWVAWYLYIIDDMATRQKYQFPAITELPSFYFHRNIHLTYIDEPDAIQLLRHRVGVRNIMWSSDYPHPVSSWPDSRALVARQFEGVPDDERELIVAGNATRVWNL